MNETQDWKTIREEVAKAAAIAAATALITWGVESLKAWIEKRNAGKPVEEKEG